MTMQWKAIQDNHSDLLAATDELGRLWPDSEPNKQALEKMAEKVSEINQHAQNLMYNAVALIGHHTGYEDHQREYVKAGGNLGTTSSTRDEFERLFFELLRKKNVTLKVNVNPTPNNAVHTAELMITGLQVADKGMECPGH